MLLLHLVLVVICVSCSYVIVPPEKQKNFACCGGCSSGVRADASYLPIGARIVLWDVAVKVMPNEQCKMTFPFDPANGESPGARRVRSGKLVGTTFPLDHDADALCCMNGGQCTLTEEDASGKCNCVTQWGFEGDYCELSVYDIGKINNTKLYPNTNNATVAVVPLPDLRHALESFPIAKPLLQTLLSSTSNNDMEPELITYRLKAFPPAALGVATTMALACLFILIYFIKCCLSTRVYSWFEKFLTLLFMASFCTVSAISICLAILRWQELHDISSKVTLLMDSYLPTAFEEYYTKFTSPLTTALNISIPAFQLRVRREMDTYSSFNSSDMPSIFTQTLNTLVPFAKTFPTSNQCDHVVILRSSISIMSVGAATGCFQCPKCAAITSSIQNAHLDWYRGAQAIQFILYQSHKNLIEFSTLPLESSLVDFHRQLNETRIAFQTQQRRMSAMLATLTQEITQLLDLGMYISIALTSVTCILVMAAIIVGLKYKAGFLGKCASVSAQLTCLVGFCVTGVVWTLAYSSRDAIDFLVAFNQNTSVIIPESRPASDVWNLLHDQSTVMNYSLSELMTFADIVKVPPLATPDDKMNPPVRYNMTKIFTFQSIDNLYELFDPSESEVLTTLFSWDEAIVITNYNFLQVLAFGNRSTPSPYTNSANATSLARNTSANATTQELQDVFNSTWPTLTLSESIVQNNFIVVQWHTCSIFEQRRRELLSYIKDVRIHVNSTRPAIDSIKMNTSFLEALEFQLKTDMEYYTQHIQQLKLNDCGIHSNCGWFRHFWNQMMQECGLMLLSSDMATVFLSIATISQLLCALFASCFATRIQKPKVKTYIFIGN